MFLLYAQAHKKLNHEYSIERNLSLVIRIKDRSVKNNPTKISNLIAQKIHSMGKTVISTRSNALPIKTPDSSSSMASYELGFEVPTQATVQNIQFEAELEF